MAERESIEGGVHLMGGVAVALERLNDVLAVADGIGQAFSEASDELRSPAWVGVYGAQVRLILEAAAELEREINLAGWGGLFGGCIGRTSSCIVDA